MLTSSAIAPREGTVAERHVYEGSIPDEVFEVFCFRFQPGSASYLVFYFGYHIEVPSNYPQRMLPAIAEYFDSVKECFFTAAVLWEVNIGQVPMYICTYYMECCLDEMVGGVEVSECYGLGIPSYG